MKEITERAVIIITVLTTLLILGMVLIEFEALDTTLLAGIIAFVGAIIGGSITLIGVNKTIEFTRKEENLKKIPDRIIIIEKIIQKLKNFKSNLEITRRYDITANISNTHENIKHVLWEEALIRDAILVSPKVYQQLKNFSVSIDIIHESFFDKYERIFRDKQSIDEITDAYYDDSSQNIDNFIEFLENERNHLLSQYENL